MILTDKQIVEAYQAGDVLIDPFDQNQVQPASYDFRVGNKGATTSSKKVIDIEEIGYLLLQPGDFGVVTIFEELRLGPQYVGRLGLRSKYTRKGLIATVGPQIDPGFHGRLTIGLANLTPKAVSLPHKDDLVTVEFHRLEHPVIKPYSGQYQGRLELGPEEIEAITEAEGLAMSEVITTLRSLSQNVAALASEVNTMRWVIPGLLLIGLTVIGIIVAIK